MKRIGWTACVLVVSSLGISGMLAGGCGGDDEAPAGTAGSGGAAGAGTAGSSAGTKAGGSGTTAGMSGGSGTAVTTDSGSDAPVACMPAKVAPTATEKATCTAGLIGDSGGTCVTNCFCNACPKEAVICLGDPKCKAVLDCADATGCSSLAECLKPAACGGVIAEAGTSVSAAADLTCCGNTCKTMCAGDGGAAPDAAKSDAPASDATTTSDAPASDAATTSDAPADAAAATDADNEGG